MDFSGYGDLERRSTGKVVSGETDTALTYGVGDLGTWLIAIVLRTEYLLLVKLDLKDGGRLLCRQTLYGAQVLYPSGKIPHV